MTAPLPALSRRTLLQASVGALAGTLFTPSVQADSLTEGWIDAHSHIWTSDLNRYPLAVGQTVDALKPRDFTAEQLIEQGRPLGVTRFVLIQHKPYHGLDNSILLDAIAQHPGRFSAVACVEAAGPNPRGDMLRLASGGVRGFRIRPDEGGADRWSHSDGMNAMWRCAGETGLAICPLINPDALPEVDVMATRFPDTTVVLDHFARVGIGGQFPAADVDALCSLAKHPHVNVKISAFYALGAKQPPYLDLIPLIRRVFEAYGAERMMWATDCPYQLTPPSDYASSLALVRDRLDFLTPPQKTSLLRDTAARVFFSPLRG